MDLKKRVRTELRDLIAQKKVEQESYAKLLSEVNQLSEERDGLLAFNQSEKEIHQQFLSTCKQEVDFLRRGKDILDALTNNLKTEITELETKKETFTSEIISLKSQSDKALKETIDAKNNAREALVTLANIEQSLCNKRIEEHELALAVKFLQGKINLLESECREIKARVEEAKSDLQTIIKEQSRHADWDQYLQAKENFLIEQFKLLGVKYVVYNSR